MTDAPTDPASLWGQAVAAWASWAAGSWQAVAPGARAMVERAVTETPVPAVNSITVVVAAPDGQALACGQLREVGPGTGTIPGSAASVAEDQAKSAPGRRSVVLSVTPPDGTPTGDYEGAILDPVSQSELARVVVFVFKA